MILSDVSQRRIITDSKEFVDYEMNRYKKEGSQIMHICDYEVIGENLYLVKFTNNRVGDNAPGECKKNRKYNAANEYPRYEKEKGSLTITVKGQDLDCVKRAVRAINNYIYQADGIISDYDNELLTALLGKSWNEKYVIGKVYISEDR